MRENASKRQEFAIIIPNFNRRYLLVEAVSSLLSQTTTSSFTFHIVVVDDGSTDGSWEALIRAYDGKELEPNIATFPVPLTLIRQPNSERGAARNTGARWAIAQDRADWLLFFDSDDRMADNALLHFSDALKTSRPGAFYGFVLPWNSDLSGPVSASLNFTQKPQGDISSIVLSRTVLSLGATLIRKDVFFEIGPFSEDRRMSGSEDWEFLTRLALAREVEFVPHLITYYRQHQQNTDTSLYLTSLDLAVDALTPAIKKRFSPSEGALFLMRKQALLLKIGALIRMKRFDEAYDNLRDLIKQQGLTRDFRAYRLILSLIKQWTLYNLRGQPAAIPSDTTA